MISNATESPSCASRMVSTKAAASKLVVFGFSEEAGGANDAFPLFNRSCRACLGWSFRPTVSTSSGEWLTSTATLIRVSFLQPQLRRIPEVHYELMASATDLACSRQI